MVKRKTRKSWLNRNKEGAIIGGILYVLVLLFTAGQPFTEGIPGNLIFGLGEFIAKSVGFSGEGGFVIQLIFQFIVGAIIGALIDSKIKPNR